MIIYKICDEDAWLQAERTGSYEGSEDDLRDGFIHFSSAQQLAVTATKHFAGRRDLVLVAVDTASLGAALKWETSRGGVDFPHLYGTLDATGIKWVKALPLSRSGLHVFPDEV